MDGSTKTLDWRARLTNPTFWVLLASGLVSQILAFQGLHPADLSSWAALRSAVTTFLSNPYWIGSALLYAVSLVVDPTSKGLMDPVGRVSNSK